MDRGKKDEDLIQWFIAGEGCVSSRLGFFLELTKPT